MSSILQKKATAFSACKVLAAVAEAMTVTPGNISRNKGTAIT